MRILPYVSCLFILFSNHAVLASKDGFFGVAHPFEFLDPASYNADLREMKNAGVETVRVSVHWKRIERSPGTYNFEATDKIIEAARENGLKVFASIVNLPDWASVSKNKMDLKRLTEFGEFVKRCVQRYKGYVREWEIWNEPNNAPFWEGGADDYTELLKVAYKVIKTEDPSAVVIGISSGSLGVSARQDRWKFVERVISNGGGRYLDAISDHPYRDMYGPDIKHSPGKFSSKWTQYEEMSELTALLARYGLKKDIYITEFGWSDVNGEDVQAAYLSRSFVTLYAFPSVKHLSWFFWREGTYRVKNLGLVRADMSHKMALEAYQNVRSILTGSTVKSRNVTDELVVFEFEKGGRAFWVLWSPDNEARKIDTSSITRNTKVRVVELYKRKGASRVVDRNVLPVSRDPVVLMSN